MTQIKPLPNYVLIEPIEEEEKSAGGVYLPETSKDKPSKGKVVACGRGRYVVDGEMQGEERPPVEVDQIVIYKKWTNQEVKHEGKTYLLVHFNELLGVIE